MYNILIWGTGKIATTLIDHLNNSVVLGFIETNKTKKKYCAKPVFDPDEIPIDYDFIIVANRYSTEIYKKCKDLNIDLDSVIFILPPKFDNNAISLDVIKELFDEFQYTSYCIEHSIYENTFVYNDAELYAQMHPRAAFKIDSSDMWPILTDKYANAGQVNNYFLQDLWAAKLIAKSGIKKHFDIGSRLDGFIAHLLAMSIDVTMIDVREFPCEIEGLRTIVADATLLDGIEDKSIESLSALCSLEHFGLGRYGDPIDPEACFKCFNSISKKMKSGGMLYISVPIGRERIEFNAHRIFYPETIISEFSDFNLIEYSCASQTKIEYNCGIHKYDNDHHNGEHRYGLFCFAKK